MEIGNFWKALAKNKLRICIIIGIFFSSIGFSEAIYCSISSSSCLHEYNELSIQNNLSNKCSPSSEASQLHGSPKLMVPMGLPKSFTDPPKSIPIIP
ncbi:MAG: hypothetical protein JO131_04645 [Gammaproteobacteria bacterium]|nr:hypothetical protein [Gammaproteobacteria bacterium]